MNETVELGKAIFGRTGGAGWFHIEDNKDNIYRVLPPMKSLARDGKYAKFYVTHRGFRGTDNRQKPFLCVEESTYDSKTKTRSIKSHCPICDWVAAVEAQIDGFKAQGATEDQIREYRNKYVFPFQAERKYYMNVVNTEGKIGILPIGSKMFKSLEALAKEQEKTGVDICGMTGLYVNFKKQTAFKGDKNAIHSAALYMHPDGTGGYRPVSHVIDTVFAQRLGPEAADLGKLFKEINIEQCAQLVALDGDARAQYVDSIFPKEGLTPQAAPVQQPVAAPVAAPASALPTAPAAAPVQQQAAPLPAPAQAFTPPTTLAPAAAAPVAQAVSTPAPAPMTFTPQANAPAPAPMTFTPPANAAPAAPQAPAQQQFAGFGNPAPAAPGVQNASQLDNAAFVNMVRPLPKQG